MLVLENIRKRFRGFELYIERLEFHEKEYTIVLGPSGSGKSTTLRIIAGLEIPDEGRVILDGEDITDLPPWKRDIGIVFQNYALYPHLTAFDNIALPLRNKGLSKEEIRKRVIEIAKILEIENILDKYPNQLSGGQQQRVALARALVKEPKVLLLDEPLSNLDARLRLDLRSFLKDVQRRFQRMVIHVTHDQDEAMAIGDRIVVLNNGRVAQVGTPTEIYRKPANLFVFTFIGMSNLIPGPVLGFPDDVVVGFRPEDAEITYSRADGIEAYVHSVQYLGSYSLIELTIGSSYRVKVRAGPDEKPKEGEKVYLVIPRDRIYIFKRGKVHDDLLHRHWSWR